MNREEWHAVLTSEPATPMQVGAIHGEFRRLGYREDEDRSARLAACAALLGLGELHTTSDLTMGQAGQLVGILRTTRDRSELAAVRTPGEHQGDKLATAGGMSLLQAAGRALAIALAIWTDPRTAEGNTTGTAGPVQAARCPRRGRRT